MYTRWAALLMGVWIGLAAPAEGATVSVTPGTSTVAEGGDVAFTVTVNPSTYVQQVELTYQGEPGSDVLTSPPFVATHTFNNPADGLVVTATVTFNNGDPNGQATAAVDVAGLTISGSASPQRAWPTTYTLQSNPAGKSLSQINWNYSWNGGSNAAQGNSNWSGKMVADGTLTVTATVSGVTCQTSRSINVAARNWAVPISCAQDNDPDYGEIPTPDADLGSNRDLNSQYVGYIFVPRNGSTDFTPARTLSQVTSGPCSGLWYVATSTLKCQRETVINRYIKYDGPEIGDYNFWEANAGCFSTSVGDFVQAVMNHEYRGTPDTFKSWEGHQGRIEKKILDEPFDPKQQIEGLSSSSQTALSAEINDKIIYCETAVIEFATDEYDLRTWGPNWGSGTGLGTGQNSRKNEEGSGWTDCVNEPSLF